MVPRAFWSFGRKLNAEPGKFTVQSLQGQCRAFAALPQEAFESEEKIRVTVYYTDSTATLMLGQAPCTPRVHPACSLTYSMSS